MLIEVLKRYYICIPLTKLISPYITYYCSINPLLNSNMSFLIEKPMRIILDMSITYIQYYILKIK